MKILTRQNFIDRLVSCGYPRHRAMRIVYDFLKEFGVNELEEYLTSIEEDKFNVEIL